MKKYDTILFDLDGTLTDPGEGIVKSVLYALDKYGIRVESRQELYKFIGPPLFVSFQQFFGFSESRAREAIDLYREYYREKGINECRLFDGVKELLEDLKNEGYKIALATSKPEIFAHRVLQNYDIHKYFDFVGGATADEKTRYTKEQVIEYVLRECGITDRARTLMVGDRCYDINGAKAFSLDSVGVTYGYGTKEELMEAGATYILDTPLDIKKILG